MVSARDGTAIPSGDSRTGNAIVSGARGGARVRVEVGAAAMADVEGMIRERGMVHRAVGAVAVAVDIGVDMAAAEAVEETETTTREQEGGVVGARRLHWKSFRGFS